jgi:two-component system, sensor histidine kinase YesM
MRFIPERFKHNNLFITMFMITVLIIVTVSVTITWTTIRMSEQFFFEKFSITNARVMNQLKESLDKFHYSIVMASNNLHQSVAMREILTKEEESNVERLSTIYTMSQLMKRIEPNLDAYEVSIIVTGVNGISFATDRSYWPIPDEELKKSLLTRKTVEHPNKLIYQYDYRPNREDGRYIVASKALIERTSGKNYGSLHFSIKETEFKKFYSSFTSPGNNVFFVNSDGIIVSSNQSELIGQKSDELLAYASKNGESSNDDYIIGDFMGQEQIILMEYIPSFDMYMFNIINKQTAFGDLIDTNKILLISMGIVFIALIIVLLASRRLTNSLSRMVKQIENTSKHDFHQYVTVSGTYETRQIGKAFNSMLDELHEYVDQLVVSQKQRQNAELAALQQQINPHFLYNTLTSIKIMANQGSKEETETMINALISLLQNTIGNVSETVTVKQEIDNLKNYVYINQKRYGNRIKVNFFVSPDCEEQKIPKLILQPFMENSFFHGFNLKPEGYIHVLVWREQELLICEVVDNGDGMEVSVDNHLPSSNRKQEFFSGIGVRNVHERIQLIYGEAYGVHISSELGEGTKVRVTLPL